MGSERVVRLYEDHAAAWDVQRGRELFERPWLDRFRALLPEGARVLDIGCGMAEPIAGYLLACGLDVIGVDSSPALIAMARARFPAQEWLVSDMRTMELGTGFDGLLAWHSFFHLSPDDQRPMFERFARHAVPGAVLMFTSGHEEGEAIGEWQGEPLYHGSLDSVEYHALLACHGFQVLAHVRNDPECGHATIWLARKA